MKYKNNLVLIMIGITIGVAGLLLYVKPLTEFFKFEYLTLPQLSISIGIGFVSVIWYEIIKWSKRAKHPSRRKIEGEKTENNFSNGVH